MTRRHRKLSATAQGLATACGSVAHGIREFLKNARPVLHSGYRGRAGFTLIEIAFACEVMMLLTLIGYNETHRMKEHAKVAACMKYQAAVQCCLWSEYTLTGDFPVNINDALAQMPNYYLGKDFEYKGSQANAMFGEYYLRCNHDHSHVGVLFIDSGAYIAPKAIYALATARGDI